MTDPIERNPKHPVVAQAQAILTRPREEWTRIAERPESRGAILRGYVLPLAAIGPVALFIGSLLFGFGAAGFTYRPTIAEALATLLVSYALSVLGVFVLAWVVNALAPQFGATPDANRAFKLAAYGATASWLAGIFALIPSLAWLGLLGLYSLYLFWVGLPILMRPPADRANGYAAAVLIVALVVGLVASAVAGRLASALVPASAVGGSGTITLPGGGTASLGGLEAQTRKLEEMGKRIERGETGPVIAPAALQALLPATLPNGYARTEVESQAANAGGFGGSNAEATYRSGDATIRVSLSDMGAMGALAAMGQAMNVESNRETATGYERTGTINGRLTTEEFDTSSRRGKYSVLVGERVMVEAEGDANSIEALKGAVGAVDLRQLERLAR